MAARDESCNTLRVQQASDALACGQNLRLPLEIHDLIISFLDPVQSTHDLANCGLVCKYWYYHARRQLFKLLSITSSAQLHRIRHVFPNNKDNILYKFAEEVLVQDVIDFSLLGASPEIHKSSNRSQKALTPFPHIALILLSRSLPNIKHLTISQPLGFIGLLIDFPAHPFLLKTKYDFRCLTEFTLSGYSIFFRDLRRLIAGFPSLVTLALHNMSITVGQSVMYSLSRLANEPPPYLTTVKISMQKPLPLTYGVYFWLSGMGHAPLTSATTDAKKLNPIEARLFSQLLLKQIGGPKEFEWNVEYKWTSMPQDANRTSIYSNCHLFHVPDHLFESFRHSNVPIWKSHHKCIHILP
ncbi:hypothetical protein C8Q75DRAFT_356450 [Abortiporus biennis]|nr:hypothetical protein C8Q75DRAFT_356450 [Abortiporus biennis]